MKKFLIAIGIVFVLVAAALVSAVYFLPIDRVKQEVAQQVKEKTGRDLIIAGDVDVIFFPNIGLRLTEVSFSNPEWAREKNMAVLGSLEAELALRPLLRKSFEIKRFVLKNPEIHLERSADGKVSWAFDVQENAKAAPEKVSEEQSESSAIDVKFGEIKIENGQVTFYDAASKNTHRAQNVDITVTMPDLEGPLGVRGGVTFNDKRVDVALHLDSVAQALQAKPTGGSFSVKTEGLTVSYMGQVASTQTYLNGTLKADVSSLSRLLAWVNGQAGADPLPIEKVSFNSKATLTESALRLQGAALNLDDTKAAGDVTVHYAGARPSITAKLTLDKVVLDRFVDASKPEQATASSAKSASASAGWSRDPIDFSVLNKADLDLTLNTQGFSLKGVDVGESKLTATLKQGSLRFESTPASLFGGTFGSRFTATSAGAVGFDFTMDGVQAKPVLATFAGFDKITGAADAQVSVTARGNSQHALVSSLAGKGGVTFKNGAVEGIDLLRIARLVQDGLKEFNIGEGKTEFVELGGTFTIASGIATNNDLSMKAPLLQVSGQGKVDLPRRNVDYRVTPVLTASSGEAGARGVGIPLMVTGSFDALKIRPDLSSVVRQAIEDPDQLKQNLKDLKSLFKGGR